MAKWPVGHKWFFMKLELIQIWLQDWIGGISLVPLEDYFKATPFWNVTRYLIFWALLFRYCCYSSVVFPPNCQFSSVIGIWMYLDNKGVASRATIQPCWLIYWVSNSFTWGPTSLVKAVFCRGGRQLWCVIFRQMKACFSWTFLGRSCSCDSQSFKVTVTSCLLVFSLTHNHKSVTVSQQPVLWLKRLSFFLNFNKNVQFVWLFYWKISLGEKQKVKCLLQFVW